MKQYLPYNILLVIAIATTGLMIFYNLFARETFALSVAYTIPGVPQQAPDEPVIEEEPYEDGFEDDEPFEGEDSGEASNVPLSVSFPLDLNLATENELRFIPQVGNVMAQRIVQYRDVLGGYTSLEQLMEIKGVGDSVFESISAYLIITDSGSNDGEE